MAKINIGLADLFNEVFGVKDEAFKPRFYSLPDPKQQGMSGGFITTAMRPDGSTICR